MLGNISSHAVRRLLHFRVHADVRICGGNLRRNFCLYSESADDHIVHSGVSSADTREKSVLLGNGDYCFGLDGLSGQHCSPDFVCRGNSHRTGSGGGTGTHREKAAAEKTVINKCTQRQQEYNFHFFHIITSNGSPWFSTVFCKENLLERILFLLGFKK